MTEDFADKRRIRARMYKLREKRLKDFYNSDDVMTGGASERSASPAVLGSSSAAETTTTTVSSSSSSAVTTMETDDWTRPVSADQKRRSSSRNSLPGDGDDEDPVVSEKIRRKSSVRTQRLQKVLNEISSSGSGRNTRPEQDEPMTPDSLTADVVMTTTTTSSSSTSSSRKSSRLDQQPVALASSSTTNGSQSIQWPATTTVANVQMDFVDGQPDEESCSYEELRSSSSVREWTEGDVVSTVEVRETWRRVRDGSAAPVTQRVTLTKTIRKRLSDGAVLEENEDEVIDDMDDGADTAVEAALRRSSIVASDDALSAAAATKRTAVPPPPVQEHFTAKKAFKTGSKDSLESAGSSASSASSTAGDADSLDGQSPEPAVVIKTATPVKRTTSSDSARSASTSASKTKRTDSGPIRKAVATSTTSSSISSSNSSRTGLGGINRSAPKSSAITTTTTTTEVKKTAATSGTKSSGGGIPRLSGGRSSPSPPVTASQPPRKKISDASIDQTDESVAEFLRLEQEMLNAEANGSAAAPAAATNGTIKRSPVSASRTTSSSSIRSTTASSNRSSPAAPAPSSTRTTVTQKSVTAPASSSTRKVETTKTVTTTSGSKLASPRATANLKPAMVRTVETTRTVTVRSDQDDKPWRQQPATAVAPKSGSGSGSNTPSRGGQAGRPKTAAALHSNVLTVLEKYVETDGCALHGHGHHHHHDEPESPPVIKAATKSPAPAREVSPPAVQPAKAVAPEAVEQPAKEAEPAKDRPRLFMPLSSMGRSPSSVGSPVLGSPSVVKKARSLFHTPTDSATASDNDGPSSPPAAVNRIRPSLESPPPAVKRESSRLWSSSSVTSTASAQQETSSVKKGRSPSPAKEAAPADKTTSTSTTTVIEEIQDLTLLENMVSPEWFFSFFYIRAGHLRFFIGPFLFFFSLLAGPICQMQTRAARSRQTERKKGEKRDGRNRFAPVSFLSRPSCPVSLLLWRQPSSSLSWPSLSFLFFLLLSNPQLNTATNYDDRSRIRAHIRTVKKQLGVPSSPMVTRKAVPAAPPSPEPVPVAKKTVAESTATVVRRSSQISSVTTTSTTTTTSSSAAEESTETQSTSPTTLRRSGSSWRRQPSEAQLVVEPGVKTPTHLPEKEADHHADTVDITSSYGTGPMDEFGRPLFGLGALRRKKPTSIPDLDGKNHSVRL